MIRAATFEDVESWSILRSRLWPDAPIGEHRLEARAFLLGEANSALSAVFLVNEAAPLLSRGFIELSLRAYSDGCDSTPVPHVEGWYVEPAARGRGLGRALMSEAECWARNHGYFELASDTEIGNDASLRAHFRCGFKETERLIKLRKVLS